jgi:hypothetical protein
MAKAKLVYDLNEPDDVYAHKRAVKSLDMALALWSKGWNGPWKVRKLTNTTLLS